MACHAGLVRSRTCATCAERESSPTRLFYIFFSWDDATDLETTTNLYVGNLAPSMSEESLFQLRALRRSRHRAPPISRPLLRPNLLGQPIEQLLRPRRLAPKHMGAARPRRLACARRHRKWRRPPPVHRLQSRRRRRGVERSSAHLRDAHRRSVSAALRHTLNREAPPMQYATGWARRQSFLTPRLIARVFEHRRWRDGDHLRAARALTQVARRSAGETRRKDRAAARAANARDDATRIGRDSARSSSARARTAPRAPRASRRRSRGGSSAALGAILARAA